jgi:hypothetical protein
MASLETETPFCSFPFAASSSLILTRALKGPKDFIQLRIIELKICEQTPIILLRCKMNKGKNEKNVK